MKKRMCKIMALAMTAAMVVPMAAQTTAFAADDKEITYWNIAVKTDIEWINYRLALKINGEETPFTSITYNVTVSGLELDG